MTEQTHEPLGAVELEAIGLALNNFDRPHWPPATVSRLLADLRTARELADQWQSLARQERERYEGLLGGATRMLKSLGALDDDEEPQP